MFNLRRLRTDPAFRLIEDRAQLTTPQLELAQRDLFNPFVPSGSSMRFSHQPASYSLPNGYRELLVPNRGRVSKVLIHPTKQTTFDAHRALFQPTAPLPNSASTLITSTSSATAKVGVNKEFFRQLLAIFKILIPRMTSKEVFLISAHTSFLLLRTYLSLLVAKLDGRLVGDLVNWHHARASRR